MANRELNMKNKFIALLASLMLVSFPQLTLSAEPSESEENDTKGEEEEKATHAM